MYAADPDHEGKVCGKLSKQMNFFTKNGRKAYHGKHTRVNKVVYTVFVNKADLF